MGGNQSSSFISQTNDFLNSVTNTFVSSVNQTVTVDSSQLETIDYSDAEITGCKVTINQNITTTSIATGKLSSTNIQDLTTNVQTKTAAAIDAATTQSNGAFSTAIGNYASSNVNFKQDVKNIIANTMQSSTVQDIFTAAAAVENLNFHGVKLTCQPCTTDLPTVCDVNLDQNIKATAVAKGVADLLTTALAKTVSDIESSTNLKATTDQTNKGALDLGIGIFVVIIIIIILAAMAYYAFQGDSGSAPTAPTAPVTS